MAVHKHELRWVTICKALILTGVIKGGHEGKPWRAPKSEYLKVREMLDKQIARGKTRKVNDGRKGSHFQFR